MYVYVSDLADEDDVPSEPEPEPEPEAAPELSQTEELAAALRSSLQSFRTMYTALTPCWDDAPL